MYLLLISYSQTVKSYIYLYLEFISNITSTLAWNPPIFVYTYCSISLTHLSQIYYVLGP